MHTTPEPLRIMDLPRHLTFGYATPSTAPHITPVDDQARHALCDPDVLLAPDWALNGAPSARPAPGSSGRDTTPRPRVGVSKCRMPEPDSGWFPPL
ncbi:hypothetical protein ACIQF6_19555 [Kitasatospora sp. NPDC092948]|uniref:hypothetical protein n=1 Tax=Kitasatospora sp. NPDC092948 TaxID=3364088 RepID=UPI0038085CCC